MRVYRECDIDLKPGERVVSITTFRDYVLIVTDRGTIYKLYPEGPAG